jgi:hypothetical protein
MVGRASASQAEGTGFDPRVVHAWQACRVYGMWRSRKRAWFGTRRPPVRARSSRRGESRERGRGAALSAASLLGRPDLRTGRTSPRNQRWCRHTGRSSRWQALATWDVDPDGQGDRAWPPGGGAQARASPGGQFHGAARQGRCTVPRCDGITEFRHTALGRAGDQDPHEGDFAVQIRIARDVSDRRGHSTRPPKIPEGTESCRHPSASAARHGTGRPRPGRDSWQRVNRKRLRNQTARGSTGAKRDVAQLG